MNELLALTLSQRKLKQLLNIIFVGSMASWFFESRFFEYSLLDITDLESIYEFFIDGHFIIPFALFYFFWLLTIGLRMLLFQLPNVFITRSFGPQITKFLIGYYTSNGYTATTNQVLPKSKSFNWLILATPEEKIETKNLINNTLRSHHALESDFTLILRAILAITIYFASLQYFGWLTYSICIAILLFMYLMQIVKYQLAEAAPEIVHFYRKKLEVTKPEDSKLVQA